MRCFSGKRGQLECTLLARWDEGYAGPWLLATDLAVEVAQAAWYGMRAWIEGGFKDLKRGGWEWHQTKMREPARAERLWLAMAVVMLWVVSVGGEAEERLAVSSLEGLPELHIARRRASGRSRPRLLSCFRRGVLAVVGGDGEGREGAAGEVSSGGLAERASGSADALTGSIGAFVEPPLPGPCQSSQDLGAGF